jgi:hypothetical protein
MSVDLRARSAVGGFQHLQAVSEQVQACGLVQTEDTGQINWSTASIDFGGQFIGYEMFAFADSLQDELPVYLKFGYETDENWRVYFTILLGNGSNGAGGLTGNVSVPYQSSPIYDGAPVGCYQACSGDGSRLAFHNNVNADIWGNDRSIFVIERSKDASGNDTAEYVYFWGYGSAGDGMSTQRILVMLPPVGQPFVTNETAAINGAFAYPVCKVPGSWSSGAGMDDDGNDVMVFAHYPYDTQLHNPCMDILTYFYTDFAAGVPVVIQHYDAPHTYLPTGSSWDGNQYVACTWANNMSAMIRWE